jgi:hypothetical protein
MSFQYQNKKRKIYDVILFNGELNVLGFRLNQLNSFVDYFIIVESEKISYEVNKELFKDFEDKIIYLKIDNDPYYYQLRNLLREILPEFEDIIFMSDVGEIPDLTKLDELMEPLKYDSLILNHHHFVWNVDHMTKNLEYGSMMFEYTRIFQNKYLIKSVINKKQKPQNFIREIIPNGWKFSYFDNDEELLFGEYNENIVFPNPINPSKTYQLIKRDDIVLPEFTHLLPHNKVGRDHSKNYLLISDSNVEYLVDDYDKICIINFDDNINETFVEPTDEKTTISKLFLPKVVLYGESTLEEFQHKYKLNETRKIVSTLFPQDNDIITMIVDNVEYSYK